MDINSVNMAVQTVLRKIKTPSSDIGAALNATYIENRAKPTWSTNSGTWDAKLGLYNASPLNLAKWRRAKALASAGRGMAHVSCHLDSQTFRSNPSADVGFPALSWPMLLQKRLASRLGDAGTGIVPIWDSTKVATSLTYNRDPRFTFNIPTASDLADFPNRGIYGRSQREVANRAGADNTITFNSVVPVNEFWLYMASNAAGKLTLAIDGGAFQTMANRVDDAGSASGATRTPEPGYHRNGTGGGQLVIRVPVTGAPAAHSITIYSNNGVGYSLFAVEGRNTLNGVRTSNLGFDGMSSAEMVLDDDVNGLVGMAQSFDMAKADLAVMYLGMNDYQAHRSVATFKANIRTAIRRQRATGTNPNGNATRAGGDVLLALCPQPNYAAPIPSDGVLTPPLTDYYKAVYELADEENAPLLDIAYRWKDYASSYALGFHTSDNLHQGVIGSADIAQAVYSVLDAA